MKENEIPTRQNRVVYTLLVVFGALGLAWALWRHMHPAAPAPHPAPAGPAVWRGRAGR